MRQTAFYAWLIPPKVAPVEIARDRADIRVALYPSRQNGEEGLVSPA
jgi:hypothetical protein